VSRILKKKMPDEDALSVDSLFAEPPKQHISFSLVRETIHIQKGSVVIGAAS